MAKDEVGKGAKADPRAKKLGVNPVPLGELWEFTALSNIISLYFQNYHFGINVGNGLKQRKAEQFLFAKIREKDLFYNMYVCKCWDTWWHSKYVSL